MEGIIVILELSGKAGTFIFLRYLGSLCLTFGKDSVPLIDLTQHLLQCFMVYAGTY